MSTAAPARKDFLSILDFDAVDTDLAHVVGPQHVGHVLSDVAGLSSPCLTPVRSFRLPKSIVTVYDVIPKS